MPALTKEELHQAILDALGPEVEDHGSLTTVPFSLKPRRILKLAVWAFTVTSPPGGRHPLESKIQLIAPGQRRDERGHLRTPDDESFSILLGYKPEEELFVLWDAYRHDGFAFSKNVQVRAQPLLDAITFGIGRMTRQLASGEELIIAARADHLYEALRERVLS
jgi:hypothetical protein